MLLGGHSVSVARIGGAPRARIQRCTVHVDEPQEGVDVERAVSAGILQHPGAKVRNGTLEVPAGQVDAANAELERIGSPARFSTARENKHGFVPELLDRAKGKIALPDKRLFFQTTNATNVDAQRSAITKVLDKYSHPEESVNGGSRQCIPRSARASLGVYRR